MAINIVKKSDKIPQSTVTLVAKAEAGDDLITSASEESHAEDAYLSYYGSTENAAKPQLLQPPYNLNRLSTLWEENDTLGQMINAMEVNADGTGSTVVPRHGEEISDSEREEIIGINEFFGEVYPRVSFINLRRALRRGLESCGVGYIEVIRSVSGKIVFLKHLPEVDMRLVKLGKAVPTKVTVTRFGEEVTVTMPKRHRRFARLMGGRMRYFKEYGIEADMDYRTGEFTDDVEEAYRATEVLYFTAIKKADSAYGVPRWIQQLPSILGSRKAEMFNLEFFDSGGLPPAMVVVEGGVLTNSVRKQLETYLSGKATSKNRAAIIEVISSEGSIDKPNPVKVKVEKFGAERQKDSMFGGYGKTCSEKVRSAFRLPPIFAGHSSDYNRATAIISYMVAEAQVFKPERDEFDMVINSSIMREIAPDYKFVSKPMQLQDVEQQLKGLELLLPAADPQTAFEAINGIVGTDVRVGEGIVPPTEGTTLEKVAKSDSKVYDLAVDWVTEFNTGTQSVELRKQVGELSTEDRKLFDGYTTIQLMDHIDGDVEGAIELTAAATELLHNEGCDCDCEH